MAFVLCVPRRSHVVRLRRKIRVARRHSGEP